MPMRRVHRHQVQHSYPRTARINALLQEILAEQLERLADADERLGLLTITAVSCEPDLRHAVVLLASLGDDAREALGEHRRSLQAAVGTQARLKRVPTLSFAVDPAIEAGLRVEEALRRARPPAGARDQREDGGDDSGQERLR